MYLGLTDDILLERHVVKIVSSVCTGYHIARSWNVLSDSSDYASFSVFSYLSSSQLFHKLSLSLGFSHDYTRIVGFQERIFQRWSALLVAYPECKLSTWLFTGEDNLDLLVKVVSARVPCCQVRIFPFSYAVH